MALQEILQSMEEQSSQTLRQITAEAKAEADKILAEGRHRADSIYQQESERILSPLKAERMRIVNEARLELQKKLQQTKEGLWTQALSEAREKLAALRGTPDYEALFAELLEDALSALPSSEEKITVEVASADKEAAERSVSGRYGITVAVGDETLGGVKVSAGTGITIVNTLDSRLEQTATRQVSELAADLFKEDAEKPEGSPDA